MGGEEFAIFLPETGLEAAEVAEKLRVKISALIVAYASQIIHVSASFGVAVLSDSDNDFNDLMARADLALSEAKNSGRNKVVRHVLDNSISGAKTAAHP